VIGLGLMDKIAFADSWEPYFTNLGLTTFDDFYDYTDTATVNKNQKRNVQRLVLGDDADGRTFFMKRFHSPHFKDMLAARRTCGRRTSQAGVEWHNARYLLENNIATYEPVCMGERTRWGIETNSFFITLELEAVCLRDLVVDNWRGLDRRQQENILVTAAKLVQTIHRLDISFPDLYIWHLFLPAASLSGDCHFSLIDLHRMSSGVRSQKRKITDLSRLCWSMVPEYFDEEHKQLLLDTYLNDFNTSQREALKRVIERYEATLNRRKTAHRYYRKEPRFTRRSNVRS